MHNNGLMTDFGIIGNPSYSPLSGWGFLCLFLFVSVLSLLFSPMIPKRSLDVATTPSSNGKQTV